MPVDKSVEKYSFYNEKYKSKDLFFGISHGVNRGILKKIIMIIGLFLSII